MTLPWKLAWVLSPVCSVHPRCCVQALGRMPEIQRGPGHKPAPKELHLIMWPRQQYTGAVTSEKAE